MISYIFLSQRYFFEAKGIFHDVLDRWKAAQVTASSNIKSISIKHLPANKSHQRHTTVVFFNAKARHVTLMIFLVGFVKRMAHYNPYVDKHGTNNSINFIISINNIKKETNTRWIQEDVIWIIYFLFFYFFVLTTVLMLTQLVTAKANT